MSNKAIILLLNVFLITITTSSPVKKSTEVDPSQICKQNEFNYFQPHPFEQSKYIQCDPWGTGDVNTCESGLVWNRWALKCDLAENVRTVTFNLTEPSSRVEVVNCTLFGIECQNGGVCNQALTGTVRCVCKPDFTGEFCETPLDLTDLTHEILNGTFSIDNYKLKLIEANLTSDIQLDQIIKSQLNNETFVQLTKYLTLYKSGDVRFDTLVRNLVNEILDNVYPDAEFLSLFNATSQNVVTMVGLIPRFLSYSRYSLDRYEEVFAQYQKVLNSLVVVLNNTMPTVKHEAREYSNLVSLFFNQTMAAVNQSSLNDSRALNVKFQDLNSIKFNEEDTKNNLKVYYNLTLAYTERLFTGVEELKVSIMKEITVNPSVFNMTLGEIKCPGAKETIELLDGIRDSAVQIWDSLSSYGFWFVTNVFAN